MKKQVVETLNELEQVESMLFVSGERVAARILDNLIVRYIADPDNKKLNDQIEGFLCWATVKLQTKFRVKI